MLIWSVRAASTGATAQALECLRIRCASTSRRSAKSSLESRSPRTRYLGSRMTARATTGPKSEPRPTSSTPATMIAPVAQARFSWRKVQCNFFSRRNLAAEGESGRAGDCSVTEGKGFVHHLRREQRFLQVKFSIVGQLGVTDRGQFVLPTHHLFNAIQ